MMDSLFRDEIDIGQSEQLLQQQMTCSRSKRRVGLQQISGVSSVFGYQTFSGVVVISGWKNQNKIEIEFSCTHSTQLKRQIEQRSDIAVRRDQGVKIRN
jgi:hypothetical protein